MMKAGIWASLFCAFLLPSYVKYEKKENNFFTVSINGVAVGNVASEEQAKKYFIEARRQIAQTKDDLVLIEADLQVNGETKIWARVDNTEQIIANMVNVMQGHVKETLRRSYTVKINEASVNLASCQDVHFDTLIVIGNSC